MGPIPPDSWNPLSPQGSVAEAVTPEGRYIRLRWEGGGYRVVFVLGPGGRQVWATWNEKVVLPTASALLLGSVFSCLLRLRGFLVLHGSAVAINGRVTVLMGGKGAGKTTTALTLVRQGASLVTDDLVVLLESPGGFQVPPGPPSLRLLPDSARTLCGSYDRLRLLGTEEMPLRKRCLDVGEAERSTIPLPLESIYVLGNRAADGPVCAISDLGPAEALGTLMANRMCNLFQTRDGHARDLAQLSRVSSQVPIRKVTRREGLEGLDVIARSLLEPTFAPVDG